MLENISWQTYWIFIVLTSVSYYGIIYLLYFKNDFIFARSRNDSKHFLFHGNAMPGENGNLSLDKSTGEVNSESNKVHFERPADGSEEAVIYTCMDELTAFFEASKSSKCTREGLLYSLGQILQKYPSIQDSVYRDSLAAVIITQSQNICSVHLRKEDVFHVW